MTSITKLRQLIDSYKFDRDVETSFADWVLHNDALAGRFTALVGLSSLIVWILVVCPILAPNEAFSATLNSIHGMLLFLYLAWCFGDKVPFLLKNREIFLTIGSILASCLYILLLWNIDSVWLQHADAFFNVVYISQIFLLSGLRKRFQFLYAVCCAVCFGYASFKIAEYTGSELSAGFIALFWLYLSGFGLVLGFTRELSLRNTFLLTQKLKKERETSHSLLANILPEQIIEKFTSENRMIAEHHENVTVLFGDIVGFTGLSRELDADRIVNTLNDIFSKFDDICSHLKIEKIKTIGDAYMAASSLPLKQLDHADRMVKAALEMQAVINAYSHEHNLNLSIRTGIHSGPVVAGVIGKSKFCFDLWGDTVNVASRLEGQADVGRILVSSATVGCLSGDLDWESVQTRTLKGIGTIKCGYLIERRSANRYMEVGSHEIKEEAS